MNKLRMSDFGDASGIHEKMFHTTEQYVFSSHVDRKMSIFSVTLLVVNYNGRMPDMV